MATWSIFLYNEYIVLNDRNPFDLISVTGIGNAPMRRLTQRGPFQHGETDIGYRYDPRVVNLALAFAASSLVAADAHRDTLARLFLPWSDYASGEIFLEVTRDDGAVRVLDVKPLGMVDMPVTNDDRIGVMQRVAVQLQAANPFWRGQDSDEVDLVEAGDGTAGTVNVTTNVPYEGTAEVYPGISVNGPITDLKIENLDTGAVLDFAGWSKGNSYQLGINLAYGYKTVSFGGENYIHKLTPDSDLATWRLIPHPWVGPYNQIRVTGSGTTAATSVVIDFYTRYVSL